MSAKPMVISRKKKEVCRGLAVLILLAVLVVNKNAGNFEQINEGPVLGLRAVEEPLPWFDPELNYAAYDGDIRDLRQNATVAVTSRGRPPMDEPVSLRLSRFMYPAEDRHLDALVRFDLDPGRRPGGRLHVELAGSGGNIVSRQTVSPIPGSQLYFSYRFPEEMAGSSGELRIRWERYGRSASDAAPFEIAPPVEPESSGQVRMVVPNTSGAVIESAPMTAGVPFPRGALDSVENLRLVDDKGEEIPLQAKETARWSRFGSVKWVLCDFTLDLDGGPREVFLVFGPDVKRSAEPHIKVTPAENDFPGIEAGRLRLDAGGVWFDAAEDGSFKSVLSGESLYGGFIEHARGADYIGWGHRWMSSTGQLFKMDNSQGFKLEEIGSEKVVLRTEGWYTNRETGEHFCKYIVRYVVHRNSPVVRIFHTWIYTGDGNRDAIRNMGWRFPMKDMEPAGFLWSFEAEQWLKGYYLLQHDHDRSTLFQYEEPARSRRIVSEVIPARPLKEILTGLRAPGVMAAGRQGVNMYIGVQDFWQNFPSSLMLEEDALTFYQWPRYGRSRQNPVNTDDIGNIWRLWFAHEGEVLDFRLPREIAEGPIYVTESGPEQHFAHGQPESVNAQGVAKTAEMWLYLTSGGGSSGQAVKVLQGLNEETLRPVVDPEWMTASGAFYEVAAADIEKHREIEEAYARSVRSPIRQVERMGVYGKWIYGDLLRTADLDTREGGLYRTFRKAHWGWPYSWLQFVRTGDTELLRFAQAATRMMSDVGYCHYVSEDVERYFAEELELRQMWARLQPFRRIGWHNRNLIPWAGYWGPSTRCYVDQADYLWDAWYVSGYHRARDVALSWAEQTKIEEPDKIMRGPITAAWNRGRWPANLQKQYIEMYESTWDPWFLAAAQGIADMHIWRYREEGWEGHFWNAGHVTWQRYSGCPEHKDFLMHHVRSQSDLHQLGWATVPTTTIPAIVFGYYMTGDEYYLRRAAGIADLARWTVYSGEEPDYYMGFYVCGTTNAQKLFASWMQTWFPLIVGAFEHAGGAPENYIPVAFDQTFNPDDRLAVYKGEGEELTLRIQGAYSITGPGGNVYMEGEGPEAVIKTEAPAGMYTVSLPGRRRATRLPVSPLDTPEVFLPGGEGAVGAGTNFLQYWFFVPEGVGSFWIEFENTAFSRQSIRQVIIWDADWREAWAHRERAVEHDPGRSTIRAEVKVAPGQSGRLWRLTLPGQRSMPFRLSPNLPRILSHDPGRWFDPEGKFPTAGE